MKRPEPRFPLPVRKGARVGVAALSGPVDEERLSCGLEALRRLGYEPVEASNLRCREGLFAGSDQERLDGFHELVERKDVEAVLFARGGHGVVRLLERIDWDLIGRRRKAIVGYSDLTPLLIAIVERCALVSFHGPMVAADLARGLSRLERTSFRAALGGDFPRTHSVRPLGRVPRAGGCPTVSGLLKGGCLSMLCSTLGTDFSPDLGEALLFVEDVGEPAYRIDRMLTHLDLSGTLSGVRGMVIGHFLPGSTREGERLAERSRAGSRLAIRACFERLREESVPAVWTGLACGHRGPNVTLPMGARARIGGRRLEVAIGDD